MLGINFNNLKISIDVLILKKQNKNPLLKVLPILITSILLIGNVNAYSKNSGSNENYKNLLGFSINVIVNKITAMTFDGAGIKSNGSIIISASGGTAPYSFTITYPDFSQVTQGNGYFAPLSIGAYTIQIIDANGISVDTTISMTSIYPIPSVTISNVISPSSCNTNDGSFTLAVSGGTPPYLYSIDGGLTFTTNNIFTSLYPGTYTCLMKDANGYTSEIVTTPVSIDPSKVYFYPANCSFTLFASLSDIYSCTNQGSIFAEAQGGKPAVQYSIDGINYINGLCCNFGQPDGQYLFDNLAPGSYIVYAKDANDSIGVANVDVPKYCGVNITFLIVNAACKKNNASIAVQVAGGNPPYTYSIDGINFQASNVFSGLYKGNYNIAAKDVSGSIANSVALVLDSCPVLIATSAPDTCSNKNGSITATATNGNPPYSFSLDGINFQSNNVFTALDSGKYNIIVKDSYGYTATDSLYVSYDCLQLSLSTINATCNNANGSISVNAYNGTPPYIYSIDGINFQTGNIFNNLAGGSYTVTAKDATGLGITKDTIVNSLTPPVVGETVWPASCADTGGYISFNPSWGAPPFIYSDNNGINFQQDSIFRSLDSAQYILVVQDANGCIAKDTIQLTALPTPSVSLGNDTVLCTGANLTLTVPSAPGYVYTWPDNSHGYAYMVSSAGEYQVSVTNQFGCTASAGIKVRFRPLPFFFLGNDTALCSGQSLLLKPSPIAQGSYLWSDGSIATMLNITSPGLYWLQVSDSGCAKSDSINVSYKPMPSLNLGNDTTLCAGQTLLLNAANNNSTYLWQDGSAQPTFAVSSAGVYSVKVDENGCDTSGDINVNYITKPVVNLGNDTTLCITQQLLLEATYPLSTYLWQDGSVQPQYTVSQAGTYLVDVTNVCGDTKDSISIVYENCACKFYVPSAFTPNNDGKNDVFLPKYQCLYSNYQLKVFNRWGLLVFVSTNASVGWDGGFNSQQQPAGVYVWELAYKDNLTGKDIRKNGTVVLIR